MKIRRYLIILQFGTPGTAAPAPKSRFWGYPPDPHANTIDISLKNSVLGGPENPDFRVTKKTKKTPPGISGGFSELQIGPPRSSLMDHRESGISLVFGDFHGFLMVFLGFLMIFMVF